MDTPSCQTTMPKILQNQSIFCPWTSRAPLASSAAVRHAAKSSERQLNNASLSQASANCQHMMINQPCSNNDQVGVNGITNMTKPSAALHCPSIQQSSSQFFNFLRLMQLFPDVHPATLHTVLVLCKSDFFCAVDKLLYAKRCKQLYNNRKNMLHRCTTTTKFNRHQPYCLIRPSSSIEASQGGNGQMQVLGPLILQSVGGQMMPLDVSIKKTQPSGKGSEGALKAKGAELRKILPRSRMRSRVTPPAVASDLPPVASLQCKLPIRPLSPLCTSPEDLSNQTTAKNEDVQC